jgi:hypothetical protein
MTRRQPGREDATSPGIGYQPGPGCIGFNGLAWLPGHALAGSFYKRTAADPARAPHAPISRVSLPRQAAER